MDLYRQVRFIVCQQGGIHASFNLQFDEPHDRRHVGRHRRPDRGGSDSRQRQPVRIPGRWPVRPSVQTAPAPAVRTAFRSRGGENRKEETRDHGAANDILAKGKGPWSVYILIDKQQLTLYSGSQPIAHSRVSTGTASHPTPTGVFSVIQKDRWHRSNLYNDAPMYYMQRITWSGVAMHQGVVPNHPASHGCIRLPEAFARQLWGITKLGVRVVVCAARSPRWRSRIRSCSFTSSPIRPRAEAARAGRRCSLVDRAGAAGASRAGDRPGLYQAR